MNLSQKQCVLSYVKRKYDTIPDHSFHYFPDYIALRHEDRETWFGLILNVPRQTLKLSEGGNVDILDVKCRPENIQDYLTTEGIVPAYHMNKSHWISILLDGSVSDALIENLIDVSFELTL
ncbi:MmcQ/YjbR family DNA-binding protein [Acetobacter tropicalis]|uniref:MmcQ/YjbR family DNA-binding protein n=1 Tax=Acetobacter tropicalis TaxID=104102 RepID=A0A094ZJ62_9PROT|nr:MmcQ/YjbR family DNA-binding protein [Acetobacter tropicalis]KGB22496.1 Protein of unknown function DUF419 [Acetobacter tropicalis]MDO8173122.1 MmcQ/YjbR family DNA-binding protein [Acetobacter tropicalis]